MLRLRFYAEKECQRHPILYKRWMRLKYRFEKIDDLEILLTAWKNNCSLESNRNLPLLNRSESGLGGDNNLTDKQLRPRFFIGDFIPFKEEDDDIIIDVFNTDLEQFSNDELLDLINAFVLMANDIVIEDCVHGCLLSLFDTVE